MEDVEVMRKKKFEKNVREAVLGMTRVSRLPDYEEEEIARKLNLHTT